MDYKRAILNFSFVVPNGLAGMARPGTIEPLTEDLAFLKSEGIGAILSLSEISLKESVVSEHGFSYLHVPIDDFTAPTIRQVNQCIDFIERMVNAERKPVAVHCGAGCGRTGTMLACYLVKSGNTADEAIETIRSMRPCSIETESQKALVYQYEEHLKYRPPSDKT
ncbi:MAG: dual specificity protein phosphatase family protein [Candidatus Lindowbacteria bacterium]|nr:dual specificity protein phosphatase family protein [Candidatus Lindowbacteria bacterium]